MCSSCQDRNRLIVSDEGCHAILILHVYVKECHLECSLNSRFEMTVVCKPIYLAASIPRIYFTDRAVNGRITRINIETGEIEHITLQHKDCDDELLSLHGIAFYNEKTLSVSDRELNKLFAVDLESKEGRHIGENSEQKSSDGESMSASHSKPLGLCVEQKKNNYVTDGASKAIRMVSNTIGLTNVLERLKLSFEIFSIHDRRENDESRTHTLDEAVDNLISDGHCFDGCIDFTRDTTNKPSLKPQGTEGSVAFKTVESIHMITNCLRSLDQNLQFKLQVSYGSHINLLSMLTLQVKHHFSNMRNRYPSPMVLQYGQQLLSTTKETIKRSTNTGYNYFTHRSSFYPLSKQSPAFSLMEFPKKDRKQQSSLSADRKDELMSFRKGYCQSVRQKTVRQQSTMCNAGTLPRICFEELEARSEQIEMWDFVVPRTEDTEMTVSYEAGDIVVINSRYFASASNASIIMAFLPDRFINNPSSNVVDPILILQKDQESCFKFSKPSTTTAEKTTKDSIIQKLDKSENSS